MSLYPCSGCNEREPGKYANVTVAWWTGENKRLAYRLKLGKACYIANIHELDVKATECELCCPRCGQEPGADMDPVYITAFVPEYGKRQLELATCAVDAAEIRVWAQRHGELLPDAEGRGQGPGPYTAPQPATNWAEAGLRWRE